MAYSSSSSVAVSAPKRKRERKYWTKDQSRILREYIEQNGEGKWEQVAINTGLREKGRSGESCRRRWLNQLKPGIKKEPFTTEEEAKIRDLHKYYGGNNKWSKIAAHLHGRTDNQVKNHWNTKLSKDVEVGQQLIHEYTNAPDFNQDVEVGDQQLLFEYANAPDFNQDVEVGDQQLLFEYANAPDFNQDVDVGDQQLLFEYTNAPDFNEFNLSDQIYYYEFSEFNLEMNSL